LCEQAVDQRKLGVGPALAIVIDVIEDAPQLATQHFYQSFCSVCAVEIAEVRDIRGDPLE
jgi:hypothetical protein